MSSWTSWDPLSGVQIAPPQDVLFRAMSPPQLLHWYEVDTGVMKKNCDSDEKEKIASKEKVPKMKLTPPPSCYTGM